MKNVVSALHWVVIAVTIYVLSGSSGCVMAEGHAGAPHRDAYGDRLIVSPDHKDAAYVWTDTVVIWPLLWPVGCPVAYARNELLGWSSAGGRKNHLVGIERYDVLLEYPTQHEGEFVWDLQYSPDSSHLALGVRAGGQYNRIEVIDVETERRTQLCLPTQGVLHQMRWVSPTEIAYVAHVGEGRPGHDPMKLALFIQDIRYGPPPREVWTGEPSSEDPQSPRWFFSPDAKSALVAAIPVVSILDLSTGQVSLLMEADQLVLVEAVWKADGRTAVLSFGGLRDGPWSAADKPPKQTVLVDLGTRTIKDLTDGLRGIEGPGRWHMAFAGKDRLLFMKAREMRLFILDEEGASPAGSWNLPDHRSGYRPLLPGWIVAGPTGLSNERNSTALSYDSTRRVPLSDHHCAVSDDGTTIAEVVRKGKVIVRPLELPSLRK